MKKTVYGNYIFITIRNEVFFPFNEAYISLKNKTNLIDWYYFCLFTENQDNKMQKKKNKEIKIICILIIRTTAIYNF